MTQSHSFQSVSPEALELFFRELQFCAPLGVSAEIQHFQPEGWTNWLDGTVFHVAGQGEPAPRWRQARASLTEVLAYGGGHIVLRLDHDTYRFVTWTDKRRAFEVIFHRCAVSRPFYDLTSDEPETLQTVLQALLAGRVYGSFGEMETVTLWTVPDVERLLEAVSTAGRRRLRAEEQNFLRLSEHFWSSAVRHGRNPVDSVQQGRAARFFGRLWARDERSGAATPTAPPVVPWDEAASWRELVTPTEHLRWSARGIDSTIRVQMVSHCGSGQRLAGSLNYGGLGVESLDGEELANRGIVAPGTVRALFAYARSRDWVPGEGQGTLELGDLHGRIDVRLAPDTARRRREPVGERALQSVTSRPNSSAQRARFAAVAELIQGALPEGFLVARRRGALVWDAPVDVWGVDGWQPTGYVSLNAGPDDVVLLCRRGSALLRALGELQSGPDLEIRRTAVHIRSLSDRVVTAIRDGLSGCTVEQVVDDAVQRGGGLGRR